jgi:hypothetical protein
MAERNEQVLDRVRQELNKNPALGSRELYDIAMGVDASIAENSLQQFHARYVLPIKRERAAERAGGAATPAARPRKTAPQRKAKAAEARPRRRGAQAAEPAAAAAPAAEPVRRRRRRRGGPDREQVRSVFMQSARDFANAESRGDIVQILSDVDRYVNKVVEGR